MSDLIENPSPTGLKKGPEPSETACGVRYRTVIESSIVAVSEYYSDSSGPILRGFEGSGVMQENASAGEKGRAWISLLVARSSLCLGVMPSLFLLAMLWGDHLLLVGFEATACRLHWTYSWGSDTSHLPWPFNQRPLVTLCCKPRRSLAAASSTSTAIGDRGVWKLACPSNLSQTTPPK